MNQNKLTVNIAKTKCMTFGTRAMLDKLGKVDLRVGGQTVEQVQKFKYLGMILDPLLNFKEHVSYMRSKIVPRLKMMDKLKHVLSRNVKLTLYKTLISPMFDYGDIIYAGLNQLESQSLQKLQNSGLRRILNCDPRTHIKDMHATLKLDELEVRRHKHIDCQVFRCLNGLAPPNVCELITPRQPEHAMTTRSITSGDLNVPNIKLEVCRKSFKYIGPLMWHKLPDSVKHATSLPTFKYRVKNLSVEYFT